MARYQRFEKDPDTTTYFTLDWSPDIRPGETLSSTTWTVGAGLDKESESRVGNVSTLWVSGGTDGTTYEATCQATYDSARTEDWTIRITCRHS